MTPYWELTFDADGDVDTAERDRLLAGAVARGVHDLIVFAHGWNSDRSGATRLYSHFFAPIPRLVPRARLGYAGVVWPSMRYSDEPIPDFPRTVAAPAPPPPALDKDSRQALLSVFPNRATVIEQIAALLEERPAGEAELERFGQLVRILVDVAPDAPRAGCAADTEPDGADADGADAHGADADGADADGADGADADWADAVGRAAAGQPLMFRAPVADVCADFARALGRLETGGALASFTLPDPWAGAREFLRQATYYEMKRRAGAVGERGLGPVLGRLAEAAPGLRVHLVGHSFGGRLVAFALRGLPDGVRTVKSVTLLQGAFSHYAFAASLPHDPHAAGALRDRHKRIDGPLVCCYSHFDSALGTLYPLASRMADDAASLTAPAGAAAEALGDLLGAEWGAMGHDGVQAVPGTRALTLARALAAPLPTTGCVNVDAAEVVRRGGPPTGAHSDIVHPELARVVLAAGRIT
ncbi:serine-threonine protein kinase [Streptomyces mangrovisoli]|uniref:Serine-threonine protein kinase n=1 Tax=Streptomyces mangrovisoli TaxID=1428628 RepID=A0A1J4NV56_9ACTN|nr:serine-threonine protein kinase [Streptomyces mangrovisoli]